MWWIGYIDTKKAAADMLKDWHTQHDNLERLPGDIAALQDKRHHTERDEKKQAAAIYGLEKAWEYVQDITPPWERLTDEERYCLTARFIDREDGIRRIMERFHVERSAAYRKSDEALEHFAKLLYW